VARGRTCAARPAGGGGQHLRVMVALLGGGYLMAANAAAAGYVGLTGGAAHLVEAFGSPAVRDAFLPHMYGGDWTGTMALTEPQAGSSLADVRARARPTARGYHLIQGNKVF